MFYHAVGKIYNESLLLSGTVAGAGTLHIAQAANEELQLYPIMAQFHSKGMGLAVTVLELDLTQKVLRYFDPEELVEI